MADITLPILFGLFVWWASTGMALYVVGLSQERSPATLAGAMALLVVSLLILAVTDRDTSVGGAYLAFTAAIGVWGAQEIAFLTGWVTGPWRKPCPEGARSWRRPGYAVRSILYHELALLGSGAAVVAATWGGPNQTGSWTFGVLFAMRISAKLNIFLGVPNVTETFLPGHLDHLKSFFARKPMNLLFPVSVTASTIALVSLAQAVDPAAPAAAASLVLLATLVALGLLEHWFLVLPLPVEALWAWGAAKPMPLDRALIAAEPGGAKVSPPVSTVVAAGVRDPRTAAARAD